MKKRKMKIDMKKPFAMFLAVAVMFGSLSFTAFATDDGEPADSSAGADVSVDVSFDSDNVGADPGADAGDGHDGDTGYSGGGYGDDDSYASNPEDPYDGDNSKNTSNDDEYAYLEEEYAYLEEDDEYLEEEEEYLNIMPLNGPEMDVFDDSSLATAWATPGDITIRLTGNVQMSVPRTIATGRHVTIISDGTMRTMTAANNQRHFAVAAGGTLTLGV